jgi:hypothetical protein
LQKNNQDQKIMKPTTIFKIAVEVLVTVSLIALLGLLITLVYALLSFLGTEPTNQSVITTQMQTPEAIVKHLTATNPLLPTAKAAPKLETVVTEAKTETIKTETILAIATKPLTKMTVQELRPLARERKIPNWRKLKKKELILYLTT